MKSGNIRIPYEKPAISYFEWDTTFRHHVEDLSNYEKRKQVFNNTYKENNILFYIHRHNKFGIYSNKGFVENQIYTASTIAEELKKMEFVPRIFK